MAGRPLVWTDEKKSNAIEIIMEGIYNGNSARSILDNADRNILPSWFTFARWLSEDIELSKQYAYFCEQRAEKIFEETLQIADKQDKDVMIIDGVEVVNHNIINRNRLQIDTRKWFLSRMMPKKYGEKLEIDQNIKSEESKINLVINDKKIDLSS